MIHGQRGALIGSHRSLVVIPFYLCAEEASDERPV